VVGRDGGDPGAWFSAPNQEGTNGACADPTPNAVLPHPRLRDSANPTVACHVRGFHPGNRHWPQVLYDAREGSYRDVATTLMTMNMGGVINYVALDIGNLKRWLNGTIGATGTQAWNQKRLHRLLLRSTR
jgi:hypothetical protein